MTGTIAVEARWDAEAGVWIATSPDTPGLVVEAATWTDMMAEVRVVLPELLTLGGHCAGACVIQGDPRWP